MLRSSNSVEATAAWMAKKTDTPAPSCEPQRLRGSPEAPELHCKRLPEVAWNTRWLVSCSAPLGRAPRRLREATEMGWEDRISVDPDVRSGKPCIKGTRITVYDVLEYLAGGMTESEILEDFPDLRTEDIRACLAFAAARERRLSNPAA